MSPEQGEGKQVDSRSDVYSLALTLYEGFTGQSPFRGKKLQELIHDVSRPDIPPLAFGRSDLPPALSDALERAMAFDRYARPDAATLGRHLTQVAKVMPDSSPYETLATKVRRRFTGPRADRDRLAYLGEHLASGAFALCALLFLLPRVPFYPEAGVLALVAVPAFLALVWPFAGVVLTLAVLGSTCVRLRRGMGRDLRHPRCHRGDPAALEEARVGGVAAGGHPAGGHGLGGVGAAASDRRCCCAVGGPLWDSSADWS